MTILRSRVRIPVVALSFLFDSKHLYEAMIYWVYSCDYSLLEAPWSKLLALLDFIHISNHNDSPRCPASLLPADFAFLTLSDFILTSIFDCDIQVPNDEY